MTTLLTENLTQHLHQLAYPRHVTQNPDGHEKASHYVRSTLQRYGYPVQAQTFEYFDTSYSNWVAALPGSNPKSRTLIIGAHFDSVPDCPGADDNASGTAVLLEAARLYKEAAATRASGNVRVEFVAFDLEECGLIGSTAYAKTCRQENRHLAGMLSLEMLGCYKAEAGTQRYPISAMNLCYPNRGDFVGLIGSTRGLPFFWKVRKSFRKTANLKSESLVVPCFGHSIPDIRRSDHAPFWDYGYSAMMITDTSFFRNPHYHTPQDTLDKIDIPFMARITEAVAQVAIDFSLSR